MAYRHGDTSLVRDARDQRFLLDVKAQYGSTLLANRNRFEHIFGRAVQTDIHGTSQVLSLLELLVAEARRPVRQVHFDVTVGPSFDTASPEQISRSVNAFVHGVGNAPRPHVRSAIAVGRRPHAPPPPTLVPTPSATLAHARSAARRVPFALEYPRVASQPQPSRAAPDIVRTYAIRDLHGHRHTAYVVVVDRGLLGQFYDVQGSDWPELPLLRDPSQTVHLGGRAYGLYYEGDNLRIVAWREGAGVYWVQNTLTDNVSPRDMLAIAQQTRPVAGTARRARRRITSHNLVLPPLRPAPAPGAVTTIGTVLALLSLAVSALLSIRLLRGRRELRELRAAMATRASRP